MSEILNAPALQRIPPQAGAEEQAVIGAALTDLTPAAIDAAREILTTADFYRGAHRSIWEAICTLADRGEPVDLILTAAELERRGQLDNAGGRAYLLACMDMVSALSRTPYHAAKVRRASILRGIIDTCGKGVGEAFHAEKDPGTLLELLEQDLFRLHSRETGTGLVHVGQLAAEVYDAASEAHAAGVCLRGVSTGFPALDTMTGGLGKGDLIILAGRTSMGKTAMAVKIALSAAEAGEPAAIFSLEMDARSLAERIIAGEAMIDGSRLRTGQISSTSGHGDEWSAFAAAVRRLGEIPLWIDDSPGLSLTDIRSRARRAVADHNAALIVVDYLHLVKLPGRHESEYHRLSELARGFKRLARELQRPVVALSQINRSAEADRKSDMRPQISQLKGSGTIEEEADVVLLLYRPWYYKRPDEEASNPVEPAELIVAKQRKGPTGVVDVEFLRRFSDFRPVRREGSFS